MTHRNDGVITDEQLRGLVPSRDRLERGPVVVIECIENIPCNPCVAACPKGVITIEGDLNNTPTADFGKCDGCGVCVSACPGLAIFVVDASGGDRAKVSVPYEFVPLPEVGDTVTTLDRQGESAGEGTVVRVLTAKALDRTPIVTLDVPAEHAMAVRHFRAKDGKR
jgi:Fe-S-cluster-containing hydrogenase component 2